MFSSANLKKTRDLALEPVKGEMIGSSQGPEDELCSWREVGLEAIGRSEVGVVLLAGGQGTRLD